MDYYLDDGAKAPTRAHNTDAGLDLYAYKFLNYQSEKVLVVRPDTTYLIDTGLHSAIPAGFCGLVLPRSSSARDGLLVHTGVIDSGYTGSIKITVNALNEAKVVRLNDRIAQLLIIPSPVFELRKVDTLSASDRGDKGFGSSGI